MYRLFLLLVFIFLVISCGGTSEIANRNTPKESYSGPVFVKNQLAAPQSIKSIQLYRKGNADNPPIITLGSSDRLVLEFDELTSVSGQFLIRFAHYDSKWKKSPIPDIWFIDGINEFNIIGGEINSLNKPSFFHYRKEFPDREINFLTSGNYMVHVFDFDTNIELFSLPFFVTEDAGETINEVETLYNARSTFDVVDQLFSIYKYPKGVEFPQFNLEYFYVQNRYWGSSVQTKEMDMSVPGQIRFYTTRQNSFNANVDYLFLDLTELTPDGIEIVEWQPELIPPKITLQDDLINFSAEPRKMYSSVSGKPSGGRNAQYVEVEFRLSADSFDKNTSDFYVAGDFNQWNISDANRMKYDRQLGVWRNSILMKQGQYQYKYFQSDKNGTGAPLPINDSISNIQQEYTSFIYYQDPDKNYQRLLHSAIFYSAPN